MEFIDRCRYLARLGRGRVVPNPQVGALISDGQSMILAEGYHQCYGAHHAEVNAFHSLQRKGINMPKEGTLTVNLEPCHHFGKTPPCTKIIMDNHVRSVVIGQVDQHPKVSGSGLDFLRENEVEVTIASKSSDSYHDPLKYFNYALENKLPFVTLKFARSQDGFIGKAKESTKITNRKTDRFTHRLRAEHQAIMVGTQTILVDNPYLNVRKYFGKSPNVIVLDRTGKLSGRENVLTGNRTVHYFTTKDDVHSSVTQRSNVNVLRIKGDEWNLNHILSQLYQLEIISLFVEGGAQLINSFIEASLWAEALEIVSPIILDSGIVAPQLKSKKMIGKDYIGSDQLHFYQKLNNA